MIQATGNFMLDDTVPAIYPDAVLDIRTLLAPDFSSLAAEVVVFLRWDNPDGSGEVLRQAGVRRFELTSADMEAEEPQIAQTLKKLERAIWKTIENELETYNQGVTFDEI